MLILPCAVDTNDARFWGGQSGPGYTGSTDFFDYLKDAFDILHRESDESRTMMSIGLHACIMRPGRVVMTGRCIDIHNASSFKAALVEWWTDTLCGK